MQLQEARYRPIYSGMAFASIDNSKPLKCVLVIKKNSAKV